MVYINMILFFVIRSFLAGNLKNCKISDNFRKKPDKKSLNNKLYEYEAIFELGFPKKKLFDFKVNFTNFH